MCSGCCQSEFVVWLPRRYLRATNKHSGWAQLFIHLVSGEAIVERIKWEDLKLLVIRWESGLGYWNWRKLEFHVFTQFPGRTHAQTAELKVAQAELEYKLGDPAWRASNAKWNCIKMCNTENVEIHFNRHLLFKSRFILKFSSFCRSSHRRRYRSRRLEFSSLSSSSFFFKILLN